MKKQWTLSLSIRAALSFFLLAALLLSPLSLYSVKAQALGKAAQNVAPSPERDTLALPAQSAALRKFTDSVGREVSLPSVLKKIAPSGPLAQIVLYTAVPDKLVGVARPFSKAAAGYMDKKMLDLPVFGQFYGKNANLNMEALLKAAPSVIIDIGEKKKTINEDMDKLQEQLGIPCVFIEASLETLPQTYEKLAELFGESFTAEMSKSLLSEKHEKAEASDASAAATVSENTEKPAEAKDQGEKDQESEKATEKEAKESEEAVEKEESKDAKDSPELADILARAKETNHFYALAVEAKTILDRAKAANEEIPEDKRVKVYWAMGDKGGNTNARESFQSQALQLLPVVNVADIEANSKGGGSEVSMEQILNWDPDVILVDNPELLAFMQKDSSWQSLRAIKEGRAYLVPSVPYGFLSNPPSVNRLMGLDWLGKLLYPEAKAYDFKIEDQLKNFYQHFYHIELSEDQIAEVLNLQAK